MGFLCVGFVAQAQEYHARPGYSVRLSYAPGEIIKHSENTSELSTYGANSFLIDIARQTDTGTSWAVPHSYPYFGVSLISNFYKADVLGSTFAVVPYTENHYRLFNSPVYFKYHMGWGLGYGTKVYDSIENPENNSLSTPLNVAFDLRGGFAWALSPGFDISVEAGLLHFSNAAVQMPNYGINLFQVGGGLTYKFGKEVYVSKKRGGLNKREFAAMFNAGVRQTTSTHERYPVHSLLVEFNFLNGKGHRLGVGAALMNDAILHEYYDWAERWGDGGHERYSLAETLNFGPYLNYEKVFGPFSALFHTGFYIFQPFREFETSIDYGSGPHRHSVKFTRSYIFNRVGIRYRFQHNIMLNLSLKTHMIQAQFLELGVGAYF